MVFVKNNEREQRTGAWHWRKWLLEEGVLYSDETSLHLA